VLLSIYTEAAVSGLDSRLCGNDVLIYSLCSLCSLWR
jgi:hypothetical protein